MLLFAPFLLFPAPSRAPLLLLIPMLWILRRLILARFTPHTPVDVPVLVLIVMGGVGFCVSPNPEWSQLKIDSLLLGVGLLYATVDLLEPAGRLRWVPAGVFAVSLGFIGMGLLGTQWRFKIPQLAVLTEGLPGEIGFLPEGETYFNPNVIGGALLWVLPFNVNLFWWAVRREQRKWGWTVLAGLSVAFSLGLLLLTQARGAWMGFVAGLLVMVYVVGGRVGRVALVLSLLALVVLTLVGPAGLVQAIRTPKGPARVLSTVSMEQRLEIWSRAQYAIADFPITGPGLDAFQYVMPAMYPLFRTHTPRVIPHAHNAFLQVALDLGLPGLVALQALYIVAFWMLWRIRCQDPDRLVQALTLSAGGALAGQLVYALTDCSILDAKPNVVFWMIIGLNVALYRGRPGDGRRFDNG
jgi:putative inorganic carbon (HCO3(-)) transporter